MAKTKMKLAKPGQRFGAACIDIAIPSILYIIIMAATARRSTYGYSYYGYQQSGTGSTALVAVAGILMLAYCVVEFVFYAKAQSIGKKLLGLMVVSSLDGTPLRFWKMLYREAIVKQASNVFMLGYIWIIVDERNRGWHDKILDTYVIDAKASGLVAARAPKAATVAPGAPYAQAQTMAPPTQAAPAVQPAAQPASAAPVFEPANAPAAAPVFEPAPAVQPAAAPVFEPAPAVQPAAVPVAPAVEPAPAPAPEVHTRNTRPAVRLDLDDQPAVAVDVDVAPAAAVKADMSMKKDELLAEAARLGISVSSKATKAEIIEAIQKAAK